MNCRMLYVPKVTYFYFFFFFFLNLIFFEKFKLKNKYIMNTISRRSAITVGSCTSILLTGSSLPSHLLSLRNFVDLLNNGHGWRF